MQPKEKERKGRKEKVKGSGAKMGRVMAKITFPMQLQKVQVLPLLSKSQLPHATFFTMHKFSSLLEIERKKEVLDDVPQPLTEQVYMQRLRVRRLTSHIH